MDRLKKEKNVEQVENVQEKNRVQNVDIQDVEKRDVVSQMAKSDVGEKIAKDADFDGILAYVKALDKLSQQVFGVVYEMAEFCQGQMEQMALEKKLVSEEIDDNKASGAVVIFDDFSDMVEFLADMVEVEDDGKNASKVEQSGGVDVDVVNFSVGDFGFENLDMARYFNESGFAGDEFGFLDKKNAESASFKASSAIDKNANVGSMMDIPSEFDMIVDLLKGVSGVDGGKSGGLSQKDGNLGVFGDGFSKTQSIEEFANEIAGIFSENLAANRQSFGHKVGR